MPRQEKGRIDAEKFQRHFGKNFLGLYGEHYASFIQLQLGMGVESQKKIVFDI